MKRGDIINLEELMSKTDGGRTIWETEIGSIPNKKIPSPLRDDGKTPAFSIFYKNGLYLFKDFGGNGDGGDIVKFLMLKYNISYRKALERIRDGIVVTNSPNRLSEVKKLHKELVYAEFSDCSYTKKHHDYFNQYELSEEFLVKNHVYAVSKWAINGKLQKIPNNRYMFCYYSLDLDKPKFLILGENVSKIEKWRSFGIPNSYLWGYLEYESGSCSNLFVCKSLKDQLCIKKLGNCSISTQNEESVTMLNSGNVEKINKIASNPIIVYGSDKQGKSQSILITQSTGWKWFNTENRLLKYNINDPAELVKEFGSKILEKELKKVIKKWQK